ncbi:hypothetical protein Ddye_008768 [Dipteronia dyeriana]|uniref:Uncharacterized protein n=1 Tax=Dipteronia dyeriana TaxID=168575 RepID=A0AAD9XAL9_9ROSI|nr:hypothetical protein Ddye_008768 [Dipteronia dyeriana]
MIKEKQDKEGRNLAPCPNDYDSGFGDEYDNDELGTPRRICQKRPMASGNASSTGANSKSTNQSKNVIRSKQTKLGENDAAKNVFRD